MKKLYLILSLVLFSFIANASITGKAEGLCPNSRSLYKCNYQNDDLYSWVWTVRGGTIVDGNNYADAWVDWDDSNEEHWLRVRTYKTVIVNGEKITRECGDSDITVRVMSLKDVTPGVINDNSDVSPGDNTPGTYTIPLLYYPKCYENIAKPVNDYEWIIPAGWEYNGTISDGTTPIKTHSITITVIPDDCTGGKVKVRGVPECTGQSKSAYSEKTINRNVNPINSSTSSTLCGNPKEITLKIGSVPNASYQWIKPSSWTWTSSTNTNIVKVMPDGLSGGEISVIVDGCTSLKESKTITLKDWAVSESTPSISGAKVICTSGSNYSLLNAYSNVTSITWSASPASLFTNTTGSGSSAFLEAKSSTVKGAAEIKFTLRNQCGGIHEVKYDIWVGKPAVPLITGPSEIGYFKVGRYFSNSQWTGHWFYSNLSYWLYAEIIKDYDRYCEISSNNKTGSIYLEVEVENGCGSTRSGKLVSIKKYSGGGDQPLSVDPDLLDGIELNSSVGRSSNVSDGTISILTNDQLDSEEHKTGDFIFMSVHPNPANAYAEINFYASNELSDYQKESKIRISLPTDVVTTEIGEYEIQIWNERKGLVKRMKSCDKRLQIPTNNLEEGIYFIHVIINGVVHKQQLIIKR